MDIFNTPHVYITLSRTEAEEITAVVIGERQDLNLPLGKLIDVYYVIYPTMITLNAHFLNGVIGMGRVDVVIPADEEVASKYGRMLHWSAPQSARAAWWNEATATLPRG